MEVSIPSAKENRKPVEKPLRVLIIEDSEVDAYLLLRELESGGFRPAFQRVETLSALNSALGHQTWDLIISDHSLNGFTSLNALEMFNERNLDIPFIIVSGTIGEEAVVKAIKAGANDFVMKHQLIRLVPSIKRELREAQSRRAKNEAEQALRRSEQELSDFFDNAAVGMSWVAPNGFILRVNQAELDLLDYEEEDYLNHSIREFYVDRALADDFLKRLEAGEVVKDFETRLHCKDGAIKHVLLNANALRENEQIIYFRCFTRDITDRKAAEAARAYLAAIVESSDDAIIGTTLEGNIVSWNSGASRMYGYTAEEVNGRSISMLMPHYRPSEWPHIDEQIKRGKGLAPYETVRRRKDESTLEVISAFSPIKSLQGRVIGISAIERDMTVSKREEQERLQLIKELTAALAKNKTPSA